MSTSATTSRITLGLALALLAGCFGDASPNDVAPAIRTQSAECDCRVFFDVLPCASPSLCVGAPVTASEDSVSLVSQGRVTAATVFAEWEPESPLSETFHLNLRARSGDEVTLLASAMGASPLVINVTGLDIARGTRISASLNAIEQDTGGNVDVDQDIHVNVTVTIE